MKIKDRPEFKSKAPVLAFPPQTSVADAVHTMSEKNFGAAVIVNAEGKPVGIVTERDFMRRLVNKGLDANTTSLAQIMTSNIKVANPDDHMIDCMRRMSTERFRHLPVVDDAGKLVAMMSQGDFMSYTWPDLIDRVKDEARRTIISKSDAFVIAGGIAIYTIAMLAVFKLT